MCWLNVAIHSESLTQIVGDFLKDLDIYFDLKVAPEKKLKLPFAGRAIQDPLAKGWLNAENHTLGAYKNLKMQITQLLWNDFQQANKRCSVFRINLTRNAMKTQAGHYFFFFHWHYSPLWALACRTMSFHFLLSATNSLHLLTPSI